MRSILSTLMELAGVALLVVSVAQWSPVIAGVLLGAFLVLGGYAIGNGR